MTNNAIFDELKEKLGRYGAGLTEIDLMMAALGHLVDAVDGENGISARLKRLETQMNENPSITWLLRYRTVPTIAVLLTGGIATLAAFLLVLSLLGTGNPLVDFLLDLLT